MVTAIYIYFEGDPQLRRGFGQFLSTIREVARGKRITFQLVACGARPVRDFMIALESQPEAFNVLLLDSEGPDDGRLYDRLAQHDHWHPPGGIVPPEQVHFMVQLMESWFLADVERLALYYGKNFQPNRLPPSPQVEQVPKDDVLNGLRGATTDTQKRSYHKTGHAPDLLASVNPQRVRAAAPHCERLFSVLEQVLV